MAPRRSRDQSSSDHGSHGPRRASHVSRACDECRKRKMKCDGSRPRCQMCTDRGSACEYKDEDKRKTNLEQIEGVKDRMDRLERLLERLVERTPSLAAESSVSAVTRTLENNFHSVNPVQQATTGTHNPHMNEANRSAPSVPGTMVAPAYTFPSLQTNAINRISPNSNAMPVTSSSAEQRLDRFQRVDEADGALVQIGPTSLWSYHKPVSPSTSMHIPEIVLPGDWVDWSRNLPQSLAIDKATHDRALTYFAAYYAPWCYTVDTESFSVDLSRCNLVRPSVAQHKAPSRTGSYSPLLHNSMLFMGLFMTRRDHPGLMRSLEAVFTEHCSKLLLEECDNATFSSLRAYNIYANCMHNLRLSTHSGQFEERQNATGYIYSGLAIAGVHQLGLNLDCDDYVRRGDITSKERQMRHDTFWTVYVQDAVRAFAAGRPSMLWSQPELPLPQIDPTVDEMPWQAPNAYGAASQGSVPGMRITVFHHTCKLMVLGRRAVDQLEELRSPSRQSSRKQALSYLSNDLKAWYREYPTQLIDAHHLPHGMLLVLMYHLLRIFTFRPFYRSDIVEAASTCDDAAEAIAALLKTFDQHHGIHLLHHNAINVIFGAATVFLLQAVGASGDWDAQNAARGRFQEAMDQMAKLSVTWSEARTGRSILDNLCTEYLPHLPLNTGTSNSGPGLNTSMDMSQILEYPSDPNDLVQWLSSHNLWTMPVAMTDPNTFGF